MMIQTADAEPVSIRLVNYTGQEILRIEGVQASNGYTYQFSNEDLPQGIYILISEQNGLLYSRKVLISR